MALRAMPHLARHPSGRRQRDRDGLEGRDRVRTARPCSRSRVRPCQTSPARRTVADSRPAARRVRRQRGRRRSPGRDHHRHRLGGGHRDRGAEAARSSAAFARASSACRAGSCSRSRISAYRDEVLPPDVRARVSVEAGVTHRLAALGGDDGDCIGIDGRFGCVGAGGRRCWRSSDSRRRTSPNERWRSSSALSGVRA